MGNRFSIKPKNGLYIFFGSACTPTEVIVDSPLSSVGRGKNYTFVHPSHVRRDNNTHSNTAYSILPNSVRLIIHNLNLIEIAKGQQFDPARRHIFFLDFSLASNPTCTRCIGYAFQSRSDAHLTTFRSNNINSILILSNIVQLTTCQTPFLDPLQHQTALRCTL